MTDHYLNPVVPQNFSNTGTLGVFSANYERDLTPKDRLRFIMFATNSRATIFRTSRCSKPQANVQTAANIETMGIASYVHTFSSNALADFRVMARDNANRFQLQSRIHTDRGVPAKFFQRRILQRNRNHHSRPERMEVRVRIRQYVSERKLSAITLPIPASLTTGTPVDFAFRETGPISNNRYSCRTRSV